MQYTLTKYLTADYLRENDFLKAYLELVDEIIFCCSMESLDVLSNMSFESMDDNYFIAYQNFFLNGLSTYDINKLDKLVLSEWFSLLHVRGELSDIDKLLKFGGSLKNKEKNVFELYHNADVPNQTVETTKDGLIYLITENNIDLDSDYFINQQIPAGYRIGLMRTPPPSLVRSGDAIYLGKKECNLNINVDSGDVTYLNKEFEGNIAFYRRRQFDQYYTFAQVYRSQYTVNQLSQYHQTGYYFFGFEIEHTIPLPVSYDVNETVYGGATSTYGEFYINDGSITSPDYPSDKNSFAVLDNTTGEVVHTSEVAHTGFISFTQIYNVAPIAHTGFLSFTQMYKVAPIAHIGYIEPLLLPNVTYVYTVVDNGNHVISLGSNKKVKLLTDSSSTLMLYDSTKVYHTNVGSGSGTTYRTEFGTISIDGNVGIINRSDDALNAFGCTTYISDSLDTEITQVVKNADDSVYTAFKYIDNGTSYYYVLDGVQSSWTDDLSSIGYTEKEYIEMAIYSPSPYRNGSVTSSSMPGSAENAYDRDGSLDPLGWYPDYYYYWDFSKRYEFGWYDNGVWVPDTQTLADMPAVADTDSSFIITPYGERYMYFGWNNSSGATLSSKKFRCHMYHDTFSVWQNSGHTDQYPNGAGLVTDIPYDSTKVYKVLYMLTEAGALVNITDLYKVTFSEDNGYLKITVPNGTSDQFAKFVLYTVDAPPSYNTAYFNPGQGNNTMSVPNAWSSSGGTTEVLYPLDSSTEIPYDSSKKYTVRSVFYADGTEVTDADLAPFTVSQYITISDLNYASQHVGVLIVHIGVNNPITGKPCGCTYIEESLEYIEILFNLTTTGDPQTFASNDYWASNIRNNNDLQTLQDFGVNIINSSGSTPDRVSSSNSNFAFTPIGLYGASGEDLGADMSNFYCGAGPNGDWAYCICIWSRNAYSTGVYKWKCRITKNS